MLSRLPCLGCARLQGAAAWALALLAGAAGAQDLAQACQRSGMAAVVPAEQVEKGAEDRYTQLLSDARSKRALAPPAHPQLVRLQYILDRLLPFAAACNDRSRGWNWQISLIGSPQLQFWSLPGGKLVVHHGVLDAPQLDDDELAALVAHAMAESLLELDRERLARQLMTKGALEQGAAANGLGASSPQVAMGAKLLALNQSRQQQLQAGRVGMILAAQAGYPPQAALSLWQKLRPRQDPKPPMLDRHPSLQAQLAELERQLPEVLPAYQQAARPDRRFSPPAPSTAPGRTVTSATE